MELVELAKIDYTKSVKRNYIRPVKSNNRTSKTKSGKNNDTELIEPTKSNNIESSKPANVMIYS